MLRGAIETATESLVSGWVYCKAVSLRDQLVLAFLGGRTIGTGRVQFFRKDLLAAGLGDGYCGFHFAIALQPGESPADVTIRLADSDFMLVQAGRGPGGAG